MMGSAGWGQLKISVEARKTQMQTLSIPCFYWTFYLSTIVSSGTKRVPGNSHHHEYLLKHLILEKHHTGLECVRNATSSKACTTTPVILVLRKLRQEDHMFVASLGYIVRYCLIHTYIHIHTHTYTCKCNFNNV
jgi:hypothetical protein